MSHAYAEIAKTITASSEKPGEGFVGTIARQVARVADIVFLWQQRAAERLHLASLSEHHLKDIGMSRADVEAEARKPFWMA